MQVFLPIAHMDVNVLLMLSFGAVVGFLSGLVGVGGGFLITPLLLFSGVPPIVAVATGSAQIVGTSASGSYAHWRLGNVDARMALMLLAGSWLGGGGGVLLAHGLQRSGQFGNIVSFLYVALLGVIGTSMLSESLRAVLRPGRRLPQGGRTGLSGRLALSVRSLPGQMRFPVSGLQISFLVPVLVGAAVGVLTALMGVGGGFLMVPVMIYLLRIPTSVVVGTSLFQLLFTTAGVSMMQAGINHAVDPLLALILVLGSAFGTKWGARMGMKLPGSRLRLILSLVVVAVAVRMLLGLLTTPEEPFTMVPVVR
jgi:uncharacterized membrane protein YfcA